MFATTPDARAQAQSISAHMRTLLSSPSLMEEIKQRGGGKPGRIDLHIDDTYGHPGPGFCLMTSLTPEKGKATGGARAHDHGASYVVYGVYKGAIEQTKYTWTYTDKSDLTAPELRPGDRFVQKEGEIAFFLPGISQDVAVGDDPPVVLRLEAQLLDRVARHA